MNVDVDIQPMDVCGTGIAGPKYTQQIQVTLTLTFDPLDEVKQGQICHPD